VAAASATASAAAAASVQRFGRFAADRRTDGRTGIPQRSVSDVA